MARRKRNSNVLARAERRIESLRSISTALDFGAGLTLQAYAAAIDHLRAKIAAYNTGLSAIDQMADDVSAAEAAVLELSEKMLMGVGSRYGRASQEYEMAGGSRRRKQRLTPSSAAPTSSPTAPASSNGSAPATVS